MTQDHSFLDVINPPKNHRLVRGIWLTHDLTVTALNELVLPTLAGLGITERSAAVAAPGLLMGAADDDEATLLVLSAGDRIKANGLIPGGAVRIIPVTGRRLHAKVALLQFERVLEEVEGGAGVDGTARSASGGILTIVTSANLTASGLTSNRETFATEWLPTNGGGPSICQPVLDAIRELGQLLHEPADRIALEDRLRRLGGSIPHRATASPGRIHHSLATSQGGSFAQALADYAGSASAPSRIVLVGPTFTGNDVDVTPALTPLLSAHTDVDIVVDSTDTHADLSNRSPVRVPTAFISGLETRVGHGTVTVLAAPVDDANPTQRRWLHGKTVIAQYPEKTVQMLGSANLTLTGLRRRNRELVICIDAAPTAADDCLAALRAVPLGPGQGYPAQDPEPMPNDVTLPMTPLLCTFIPDAGQDPRATTLSGTLRIPESGPVILHINADAISVNQGEAHVVIDVRDFKVEVETAGGTRAAMLTIEPQDQGGFYNRIPSDLKPDPVDVLLQRLLHDVGTARHRALHASDGTSVASNGDGGFRLPPQLVLNLLARYRKRLWRMGDTGTLGIADQMFTDSVEKAVAKVVVDAATGHTSATSDPLLEALSAAIRTSVLKDVAT